MHDSQVSATKQIHHAASLSVRLAFADKDEHDVSWRSHWRQWFTTPSTLTKCHVVGTEVDHLREHVFKWRWHPGAATTWSESICHKTVPRGLQASVPADRSLPRADDHRAHRPHQ
eukprot:3371240-Pyramimonas_sp.AAC.1